MARKVFSAVFIALTTCMLESSLEAAIDLGVAIDLSQWREHNHHLTLAEIPFQRPCHQIDRRGR